MSLLHTQKLSIHLKPVIISSKITVQALTGWTLQTLNGNPLTCPGDRGIAQEQSRARQPRILPPAVPAALLSWGSFVPRRFTGAPARSLSQESPEGRGAHGHLSAGTLAPGPGEVWKFLLTARQLWAPSPSCVSHTAWRHQLLQRTGELWNSPVDFHATLFKQTCLQMQPC